MDKINAATALRLLKDGYVLEATEKTNHYIFVLKNNKIIIKSKKYAVSVGFSDFLTIYRDFNFNLIEVNSNQYSIDLSKDQEYYEKLQKKQ